MISSAFKLVLGTAVCLATSHATAQKVTSGYELSRLAAGSSQIGTTSSVKNLMDTLSKSARPWEKSQYANQDRSKSLQTIFNKTSSFLKSPNRVQRVVGMGGMDGGGGNALICQQNGHFTSQLLDLEEAEQLGLDIDFGPSNSFEEKLDFVLDRLSKVSPVRAQVYKNMAKALLTRDTQWVQNTVMPVIDDVKLTTFPQGCLLVQVAIQRPLDQVNIPNAKTYIIDRDMFSLLDEDSKAALVLHEILYREARYNSKTDSVFSRHMVGLITSRDVTELNLDKLNSIFQKNGVSCLETTYFPAMYDPNKIGIRSSPEENKNGHCGYVTDLKYRYKGTVRLSLDPVFSKELGQENGKGLSGYSWNLNGSIWNNEIYSTSSVSEYDAILAHSVSFEGYASFSSYDEGNKTKLTTPFIKITNGSIETLYFTDSGKVPDSELVPIAAQILSERKIGHMGYLLSTRQVIRGDSLEINSPYIRYKSAKYKEDGPEVKAEIYLSDSCLLSGQPEDNFLVYVGPDKGLQTQNGWMKADTICFNGSKISEIRNTTDGKTETINLEK